MNFDLDPSKLAQQHVNDGNVFEFPFGYEWHLGKIFGHQITRFMVIELAVAILMVLIFVPLARKLANGRPPKGRFWNMFEAIVLFVRDWMVRPADRSARRRPLPAVHPHPVLLHPVLQPDGPDSVHGFADGVDQRDGALGGDHVRGRHCDRA